MTEPVKRGQLTIRAADICRIYAGGGCRAYSRECLETLESKDGAENPGKSGQGISGTV
ncbi:MAG: hypothetical protein LBC27_08285 [Spirochaetaceae bacterium]|nr:hypothetical protein [Spirochaetaceae bacterium]